ncbi:Na+/H+ antiporter NhaC family protein [Candidatus Neomarinimicrobiota bacterium]
MSSRIKLSFTILFSFGILLAEQNGVESSLNWLSVLPPLVAIILALVTRETLVSLFAGIWIGVTILKTNLIDGLLTTLDTYLVGSLADTNHASIILFTLGFGGMIGVISANGGMRGIVDIAVRHAKTRRQGQVMTVMMGVIIFFDDYANTLLVGNMMRPLTDKLRISREKLSYLVDSTAAPVASLAVISTWSIFQMSLLNGPYEHFGVTENPYITFLRSIPYSFYCLLTIIFILMNTITRREFGPMYKAERRAVLTGAVMQPGANPMTDTSQIDSENQFSTSSHWINSIIPIIAVVVIAMLGLYITGKRALEAGMTPSIRNIIGGADSYAALMWGSYSAGIIAIIITVSKRLLSLQKAMNAWLNGARAMLLGCSVLILAWTLGKVSEDLGTAQFLVEISSGFLTPHILPAVIFLTAAAISFSTGTSWATMSILVPIVMPMAMQLIQGTPNEVVASPIFVSTFAAILSGSVLGDHCSPISDTTILSSTASGSDHIDHVRTQLPYALTIGIIALIVGYLAIGYGGNLWFSLIIGSILSFAILMIFGKPIRRDMKT